MIRYYNNYYALNIYELRKWFVSFDYETRVHNNFSPYSIFINFISTS